MTAARKLEPVQDDPVLAAFMSAPLDERCFTEDERAEFLGAVAEIQQGAEGIPAEVVTAELAAARAG
jgi:hypothetical protein